MEPKDRKGLYLVIGGATGAGLVWLCFAKSASKPRRLIKESSEKARHMLESTETVLDTVRFHANEISQFLSSTADKFERTNDIVQRNVVNSVREVSSFLKQLAEQLRSIKSSRAA